jgi:[acyl-carrier-protein] S-malonyltransferase
MKAYIFPGQGAQFPGMGKEQYEADASVRNLFEQANDILGYRLSDVMFNGSEEELKQTRITQPAIFVYSLARVQMAGENFRPAAVAGHSLGEFTALVAAGALTFADGLQLVRQRAEAMQRACELTESTMAAVLGLDDANIEAICAGIDTEVVVPANYNSPGQLVISGSKAGIQLAIERLQAAGARRVVELAVGGAFHSPLMQPAQDELQQAIESTPFQAPNCPVYQNVDAMPHTDPAAIQINLIRQLTAPVRWTQTVEQMAADGYTEFIEAGGKVLQGLVKKINRSLSVAEL